MASTPAAMLAIEIVLGGDDGAEHLGRDILVGDPVLADAFALRTRRIISGVTNTGMNPYNSTMRSEMPKKATTACSAPDDARHRPPAALLFFPTPWRHPSTVRAIIQDANAVSPAE
jgi:hypothetical protein